MTKMINMTELDKLTIRLAAMPPKTPDALSQKEVVEHLAQGFKDLLALGYTIEDAYAQFMDMEGANLKLSTFRTYLNQALDQKPAQKTSDKKKTATTKKTVTAVLDTTPDTPAQSDNLSGDDDHDEDVTILKSVDQALAAMSDNDDDYLASMSPAHIERMSGSNGS